MIYSNGKLICHGKKLQMRQYARLLQNLGYPIRIQNVKLVTQSAVYQMKNRVEYTKIVKIPGAVYEPEVFHAVCIKRHGVHFTVYRSGKVIITGLTKSNKIYRVVQPTL